MMGEAYEMEPPAPLYCVSYQVQLEDGHSHVTITRPFKEQASVDFIANSAASSPAIQRIRRWRCEWVEITP